MARLHQLALLLAAALVASATPALAVVGTLGAAVSVTANSATTITFATGESLTITMSADSDVTLSAYASASVSLPEGYSSLDLSSKVGYTLATTGSGSITSASFTTGALAASVYAAFSGGVTAGCLRLDASASAYTALTATSYSSTTKKITVPFPATGSYVFVSVQQNVPLPTLYGEARVVVASERKSYSYPEGLQLSLTAQASNSLTVNKAATSGSTVAASGSISAYWDIDLATEATVDATISYKYAGNSSITADLASSLRFAYYSASESAWVTVRSGVTVDTIAKVVTQNTTHFSKWTVRNGGDVWEASSQELTFTNPSKCYALDWQRDIGVLHAEIKKTGGSGTIALYTNKGTSCPTSSAYDFKTGSISDVGNTAWTEVTGDTDPKLTKGDYRLVVRAEGLTASAQSTKFSLTVTNPLFKSSAATTVLSMCMLAFIAVVTLALAL